MIRATGSPSNFTVHSGPAFPPQASEMQAGNGPVERTSAGGASEIERSLLDIDFASLRRRVFTPAPPAWENQVSYFLLVDRFADGNERGGHLDKDGHPVDGGKSNCFL
jgi:hypothetical protein